MKRVLSVVSVFLYLCNPQSSHAQATQGIPYLAAAHISSSVKLASTAIAVRVAIRDSVVTGMIIYKETFSTTNTKQGVFTACEGWGSSAVGTYTKICRGANSKSMHVEMDAAGGASHIYLGTTEMMVIPFAPYSITDG